MAASRLSTRLGQRPLSGYLFQNANDRLGGAKQPFVLPRLKVSVGPQTVNRDGKRFEALGFASPTGHRRQFVGKKWRARQEATRFGLSALIQKGESESR